MTETTPTPTNTGGLYDTLPGGHMRRFEFHRTTDHSGCSGTGTVVEGIQFSSGTVVLQWLSTAPSLSIWPNINMALGVHGHNGATTITWLDPEPSYPMNTNQHNQ